MDNDYFKGVCECIEEYTNLPPDVTLETNLRSDLGMDSLKLLELVFQLEEKYELELPDDMAANCNTIGEAVQILEHAIALKQS